MGTERNKTPKSSAQKRTKRIPAKPIKETCPSFRRGHLPDSKDVKRLRTLSFPHVGSFDYFLEKGLVAGISDIEPFEHDLIPIKTAEQERQEQEEGTNVVASEYREVDTLKIWIENVRISKPVMQDQTKETNYSNLSSRSKDIRLLPRQCRELGLMYSGPITGDFCYQVNHRKIDANGNMSEIEGNITRLHKRFGDMPIMVMSKGCNLHGSKPEQLVKMREEVGSISFKKLRYLCIILYFLEHF